MSTETVPKLQASRDLEPILELMKEYLPRLDERLKALEVMADNIRQTEEGPKRDRELQAWHRKSHPYYRFLDGVEQFVRRVSQILDHGELDEVQRIELELRLADLESLCDGIRSQMNSF